ncbi:hypothetical protein C8J56DRAFT_720203, partial [Mycena floridula]
IAREVKDGLYLRAVALYKSEHSHSHNVNPKSYQKCCNQITEDHRRETGKVIKLSHATLRRHVKGGISLSASNASRGWLLQPEVEIIINYSIEMASRNFPLNHERLKRIVDQICRARLGDEFPEAGVGKNWTDRFVEKH